MKARRNRKSCGRYFKSAIKVCMLLYSNASRDLLIIFIGSRYIYELYYEKEAISKPLYDWLLKNGYADGNLIAKWKKQGYEKVNEFAPKRRFSLRLN